VYPSCAFLLGWEATKMRLVWINNILVMYIRCGYDRKMISIFIEDHTEIIGLIFLVHEDDVIKDFRAVEDDLVEDCN